MARYRMRNIITHAYFDIDSAIVWRTIQDDIPIIIEQIETIIQVNTLSDTDDS
jgi:uncharacterized protein with HEPN domain